MQYEVVQSAYVFITLPHVWTLFEEVVFTPYVGSLFVIIDVFASYGIVLISSGYIYTEKRDLRGDYEIICKQYLKQRTVV